MHTSLDGFPRREMDWVQVDDELFSYSGKLTKEALHCMRVTFE